MSPLRFVTWAVRGDGWGEPFAEMALPAPHSSSSPGFPPTAPPNILVLGGKWPWLSRDRSFPRALLVSVHTAEEPSHGRHIHKQAAPPAGGCQQVHCFHLQRRKGAESDDSPRTPVGGRSGEPCPGQRDLEAQLITGLSVDQEPRPGEHHGLGSVGP